MVIENIARHWAMQDGRSRIKAAIDGVAEVGNPTIVATLTVVAALLPMLFVSGLMGPYMSPIPSNASAAMMFSFFVAVILTPWLMMKIAGKAPPVHHEASDGGKLGVLYRLFAAPVLRTRRSAKKFLIGVGVATLASLSLFYFKLVTVKLAALRQQGGNRHHRRPAVRNLGRGDQPRVAGGDRSGEGHSRNPLLRDLCRHCRALQFQRSGAPLLHAQLAGSGRHADQS